MRYYKVGENSHVTSAYKASENDKEQTYYSLKKGTRSHSQVKRTSIVLLTSITS